MTILTMLTDFGTRDYYVAAMKGVVLSRAPAARIVDLSHEVPPGRIATASFLLAAAAPEFPPGTVHLAVVDPGVGTDRRILAARSATGQGFVAPDNGLLEPFLREPGTEVREVRRPDLWRADGSRTFHGRDRFAPTAAAWAAGEAFEDLGPLLAEPVRAASRAPTRIDRGVRGTVVHVDRFGNVVTDLPEDCLPGPDVEVEARIGARRTRRRAAVYAEIPPGEPAILVGSLGTVELSLPGASLAAAWSVEVGAPIEVGAPVDGRRGPGGPAARPGARLSATGEGKEWAMTRWEYKIINIRSENYRLDPEAYPKLNELGEQGWELVGLTSVNFKTGATDNIAMVFKRPLD